MAKKQAEPQDEEVKEIQQLPAEDAAQVDDGLRTSGDDLFEPVDEELAEEEESWSEEDLTNVNNYIDDISDDSVRMYLREIGKIPLLTPSEELALARRIKLGTLLETKRKTEQQLAEEGPTASDLDEDNEDADN